MKKNLLCILFAVLLCLALCGCGSYRTDHGTVNGDMDLLPDVTPMVSPDTNDGVVTDRDGIIGNGQGSDSADNGNDGASPSPDQDNGMTTMPTTAPSASPNP